MTTTTIMLMTLKSADVHLQFAPASPTVENQLECALCGDGNPRRLERQSCSEWHHTI